MDFILKNLANFTKIVKWLTFKKVLLLAVFIFSMLVFYTAYEQRVRVAGMFSKDDTSTIHNVFIVSSGMQDQIKLFVQKRELVKSVIVWTADIHLNQRTIIFRHSDDQAINESFMKMIRERGNTLPIFTDDPVNNTQMVSVINGEFACYPFKATINNKILPDMATSTPTVCRISLPPYYGDFSGYLSFSLARTPSTEEQKVIEIEVKHLASELFFKDIVKR